jgi:TonB family protein
MFAFQVHQKVNGDNVPEDEPGPPVAHVDMVISQERVEAPRVGAGSETRPPMLKSTETATPGDRAKRAGIPLAATTRATLLVRVSEEGKPGEVTVAESSGDTRLDQVAVEYAQSLEWSPALVSGRESTMSIQLPVEFQAGS